MRVKITQISFLLMMGLLFTSCSKALGLKVYNNSGQNVKIINSKETKPKRISLPPSKFVFLSVYDENIYTILFGSCAYTSMFKFSSNRIKPFIPDFREDQGWTINAQIDKKMNIYLLPFDIEPPVESDQLEKIGYKLPRESKVCS